VGHHRRPPRFLGGLLGRAIALLIGLLVAEGIVRLAVPRQGASCSVNEWDPRLGIRQRPGARGFVACRDYRMDLRISSQGLRDREYHRPKPTGRRRILCLGDSFTCGYGVSRDQTYPKVTERLLQGSTGSDAWEVINAGVGSTGTAHQVAWYELEGRAFTPDLVVCCFLPTNDFWDNETAGLFALSGDTLRRTRAPRPVARIAQWISHHVPDRFLSEHSRLLNVLQRAVTRLHYRRLDRQSQRGGDEAAVLQRRLELTERLFRRLHEAVTRDGASLLVMIIPPGDDREGRLLTGDLVNRLRGRGIPVLRLGPALVRARRQGATCTYPHDRHWTADGHAVVADTLTSWLLEHAGPFAGKPPARGAAPD